MPNKIAIIGGSGVYQLEELGAREVAKHDITTPFGKPSEPVVEFSLENQSYLFIPRHGFSHQYSPSEVNYRANIYALKKLGARYILSLSAVGSLKENIAPGDFVFVDQFFDFTKGLRERTFFGSGAVGHVSCAFPVEKNFSQLIFKMAKQCLPNSLHEGGTYVCIEGPQFSTLAESKFYRTLGASVIGMTNVPEAFLAKEAGMSYASIGAVTDYDCWFDQPCSVEEIMHVMHKNNKNIQLLLKNCLAQLNSNLPDFAPVNQSAVMTKPSYLTQDKKDLVSFLLS